MGEERALEQSERAGNGEECMNSILGSNNQKRLIEI